MAVIGQMIYRCLLNLVRVFDRMMMNMLHVKRLKLVMVLDDEQSDAIDVRKNLLIQLEFLIYVHFVAMVMAMKLLMMKRLMLDMLLIFVINVQVNEVVHHLQKHSKNLEKDSFLC